MNAELIKPTLHIRWMIRGDMSEVLQIERDGSDYPWVEDDFLRCLRQLNCIGMVAEQDNKIIGFMIYELHKSKIQLLNLAVHQAHRHTAVGLRLIAKLTDKLSNHRRTKIVTEVRETNLPAQLFFHAVGFRATKVIRECYDDSNEDAFIMQYRFTGNTNENCDVEQLPNVKIID